METLIIFLLPFLVQVESNGDLNALGDYRNGKAMAFGQFQLWEIYVKDVNRVYKTSYTHKDAFDHYYSHEITYAYLLHYGKHYERTTGKKVTLEVLARIHNGGGSNGYRKQSTEEYWEKVLALMKSGI